jgi:predicted short-subunit dehydrogenase-like oxidoreductase (DUF2520 family)
MTSTPKTSHPLVATVTIVGRGRLGRATAAALRAAGMPVTGPTGRGEAIAPADVVLLCVPDAEIADVAATLRDSPGFVGHMSGATPLASAKVDFGLHPLQTFVGGEGPAAFEGIWCAVAGRSPAALDVARQIATRLGARSFTLDDDHRASYHAAASIASSFVVTLLAAAEKLAATAGLGPSDARALLAPLVRSTVDNWAARGPEAALTGPVARGDAGTVGRQRDAIASDAPDLLDLFDTLLAHTRALAAQGGPAT